MGDGPPGFTRDSPCPALLRNLSSEPVIFRLPGSHRLRPIVPDRSTRRLVCDSPASRPDRPCNPAVQARRFGLFRVRSPLLTESLLFSFPAGTEMVHFPALSSTAYVFSRRCPGITPGGFPHSEIFGSTLVCSLPKLIAACRVLHRLLAPRHPPYALSSLTFNPRNRCRRRLPTRAKTGRKPPTPPEHLTHCVLCGRKNYRLQDIQLSKSRRRRSRFPAAGARTGAKNPSRTVRRTGRNRFGFRPAPNRTILVENTGLEPATSWLQTRRSPS